MDEHMSNVGGPAMSMENSNPSMVQGGQVPQQPQVNSAAGAHADTSALQPQVVPQSTQQEPVNTPSNTDNVDENTTAPVTAEDTDLIEKEWVQRAETIVEKTRRDPFLQSQELNRLKTEYLQKRYGKNVGMDGR